jgi:hypothetical protein
VNKGEEIMDPRSKLAITLSLAFVLLWAIGGNAQVTVVNANVPAGFGQAGYIQAATLDTPGDPNSGGTLTMNGIKMIVPRNSVLQFPANTLHWADLFDPAVISPIYDTSGVPTEPNLAIPAGTTGLALVDNPGQSLGISPYLPFNAIVLGNIDLKNSTGNGVGAYIVGLILPVGQDLGNGGAGFINCIDYTKGRFEVGGTLSTTGLCGATPTGTVIEINDPLGRYGWAHSPDPRWSVDADNPTIASGNGYPMCLPRFAPPKIDPDCPLYNRPLNTTGDPFLPLGAPLTVIKMPASKAPGTTTPDPWKQAPLMVGDYVAYAGVLYKNNPTAPINPLVPWNQQTYISANTVGPDKVEIITSPCTSTPPCTTTVGPAYMQLGRMVIGTGGTPLTVLPNAALGIPGGNIPLPEPRNNIVVVGFVTDSTQLVDIMAVDIDPNSGNETHRLLGTVLPEPGFAAGRGNKGRFRFEVGKGSWGNRTRVYMAQTHHGTVQVPNQTGAINPPQGGLLSGQYHAPMFTFQFPDAPPGFPIIPQNFNSMPFLTQGEGGNPSAGPLAPFPPFCPFVGLVATCQP